MPGKYRLCTHINGCTTYILCPHVWCNKHNKAPDTRKVPEWEG